VLANAMVDDGCMNPRARVEKLGGVVSNRPGLDLCGRWTRPIRISSDWRNRFKVDGDRAGTREEVLARLEDAVARYRLWLPRQPGLMARLSELRGKDLICWCAPDPCHADVLLELANGRPDLVR
jgi:hypothetical protein